MCEEDNGGDSGGKKKEVERGVRVENGDGAADTQHINTS